MTHRQEGTAADMGLRLRSAIRGRERWEVKAIRRAPHVAEELETALSQFKGVLSASANPVSGRVLILYEPETLNLKTESLLRDCLAEVSSRMDGRAPVRQGDSALVRILKSSLPERGQVAVPLLLSVLEHVLKMLQALSFVGILGTAREEGGGFLKSLGLVRMASRLWFMTGLSLLLTGAHLGVQYLRKRAWRRLAQTTQQRLRTDLITHIQMQDMAFFDRHGTGRLIKLVTEDTAKIGELVERGGDEAIQKLLIIVVSGSVLLTTSLSLALLVCLPLPVIILTSRLFRRMATERYARTGEISSRFTQALENSLVGVADTKSFTAERQEIERLHEYSVSQAEAYLDAVSATSMQSGLTGSILSAGFNVASGYGGWMAAQGTISFTEYMRLVFWFPQLLTALMSLEGLTNLYHRASHSAEELAKVFDSKPQIRSGPIHLAAEDVRGEITFEHVSFGYQASHKVLDDVSFHIKAGETVGIVGPTGSGKSTLLRLLLRLYEVDAGRILLDGHDIRELRLEDLRAAVSLVSQDAHLFQGTIRENVLYGAPHTSSEQIMEALRDAGASDVLRRLPGGLEAEVGERGRLLSGGERQRVAIARSLRKLFGGAALLTLDEATSHLDNETEAALKRSLRRAAEGKSVIMIAHRLSTIRSADKIIVLERGKVVEEGRHEELVARAGLYASLWKLQTEDPFGRGLEVRLSEN